MMSRSDLVYRAAGQVPSRFLLVRAAAKATRLMHRGKHNRIASTINEVLISIGQSADSVIAVQLPAFEMAAPGPLMRHQTDSSNSDDLSKDWSCK